MILDIILKVVRVQIITHRACSDGNGQYNMIMEYNLLFYYIY